MHAILEECMLNLLIPLLFLLRLGTVAQNQRLLISLDNLFMAGFDRKRFMVLEIF